MKKLISIILTIVLSFFMFYCTSTFATTETRDCVVQVYTDGNDGKENIKSNKTNTLNIFKKFLTISATVGSAALITFAAFKKNITNLWNSSVDNDNSFNADQDDNPFAEPNDDKPANQKTDSLDPFDSNNSNWVLQCLPATLETLLIISTVLLPAFNHN